MAEQGDWVIVDNPSGDPDWNDGKWRYTGGIVEYVNGVGTTTKTVTWEKWVLRFVVPTEPGVYFDRIDDVWVLNRMGEWHAFDADDWDEYSVAVTSQPYEYGPFRKASVREKN